MSAAYNGHTEIVELLINQKGMDINRKNVYLLCSLFILNIFGMKLTFKVYQK